MKPTLLYDGECGFCRYWVGRWSYLTGDSVRYSTSQEAGEAFPDIAPESFAQAVQFIDENGGISSGADAIFRVLTHAPHRAWMHRAYTSVPGVAAITETVYRIIASHRQFAGRVNRLLWGLDYSPTSYTLARWFFLRNLGAIFFVAFLSLYVQLDGLIGEHGILPAQEMIEMGEARLGTPRFWRYPTIFWMGAGDHALHAACIVGMLASFVLCLGIAAPLMTFLAWFLYLSFLNVGRDFLSFQWDILLLEVGFLAIFFAPFQLLPRLTQEAKASPWVRLLLWWLLFKLMISSGLVKLDDLTWRNLTALNFHYETQPIPNLLAWHAHQLPEWIQKFSVLAMFAIELVVPFCIFMPRRIRHAGAVLLIALQLLIIATGNYTFFNWLTIVLCLVLFDDAVLTHATPSRLRAWIRLPRETVRFPRAITISGVALAVLIAILSAATLDRQFSSETHIPQPIRTFASSVAPYRLVSGYGLFAHMTTARREIIIEGSNDTETWHAYEFPWKPGDPGRRPRQVAPHQPRLDWQMWFAALSSAQATPWFSSFMSHLLLGTPQVLALLDENPFPDAPPKYLRATMYDYHFTNAETRSDNGTWWRREYLGMYFGPVTLRE